MNRTVKYPTLPLILVIVANGLTLLNAMAAEMLGFGRSISLIHLLAYLSLSLPLPIVLLVLSHKSPVESWGRNIEMAAEVLLGIQVVAAAINLAGELVFLIGGNYFQWLYGLSFFPGYDLLSGLLILVRNFLNLHMFNIWMLGGMIHTLFGIAAAALYLFGTAAVAMTCRQALQRSWS